MPTPSYRHRLYLSIGILILAGSSLYKRSGEYIWISTLLNIAGGGIHQSAFGYVKDLTAFHRSLFSILLYNLLWYIFRYIVFQAIDVLIVCYNVVSAKAPLLPVSHCLALIKPPSISRLRTHILFHTRRFPSG